MSHLPTSQSCIICSGAGRALQADWANFFDAWFKSGGGTPAEQFMARKAHFSRLGYDGLPDVFITCSCCLGTGWMQGSIHQCDVALLPAETASGLGLPPVIEVLNKPGMAAGGAAAEQVGQEVSTTGLSQPAGGSC